MKTRNGKITRISVCIKPLMIAGSMNLENIKDKLWFNPWHYSEITIQKACYLAIFLKHRKLLNIIRKTLFILLWLKNTNDYIFNHHNLFSVVFNLFFINPVFIILSSSVFYTAPFILRTRITHKIHTSPKYLGDPVLCKSIHLKKKKQKLNPSYTYSAL